MTLTKLSLPPTTNDDVAYRSFWLKDGELIIIDQYGYDEVVGGYPPETKDYKFLTGYWMNTRGPK